MAAQLELLAKRLCNLGLNIARQNFTQTNNNAHVQWTNISATIYQLVTPEHNVGSVIIFINLTLSNAGQF